MVERSSIQTQSTPTPKRFCQLLSARQLSHIARDNAHVSHIFLQPNRPVAGIQPAQRATEFIVIVSYVSAIMRDSRWQTIWGLKVKPSKMKMIWPQYCCALLYLAKITTLP
jgi:hypothetical protein